MERIRGPLTALLSLTLCAPTPPSFAQSASAPANKESNHPATRPAYQAGQIRGDERILHALNRFTFGPRPGDLDVVRAVGLDQWFDQQLKPAGLDETELNARLLQFPAMQWSPEDLLFRLPSDAMIRQASDGKVQVPATGALHAVYENQMVRYQIKKQEKEEKKQQLALAVPPAMAGTADGTAPGPVGMVASPSMAANPGTTAAETNQTSESVAGQSNMMAAETKPDPRLVDEVQIERILALPPMQRVARLVAFRQPEFDSFRKQLKPAQRAQLMAGLTPELKEVLGALENPKILVNEELTQQRLTRDIYSNAQLQEVMTDFWLNHFNVFLHKNDETPYYLVSYERDVIRPHALGKFEDLLEATAHGPAMLLYLDNASSMGPDSLAAEKAAHNPNNKQKAHEGLNENYARELMELHTLGVNGGYTQKDVTQVARVFTGWTVDRPARGGEFKFDENRHEPGTKQVLGKKIKDHGELEGREVLHMLASSPSTAKFLSRKLAIRFVSDDPPQSLVDHMSKSYLSSGGDIPTVLRTLFHSPEFWATSTYRAKVKTPIEFVVSAVRASDAKTDDLKPLVNALQGMGMPLYGMVPPTGYSWLSEPWVSAGALVNRMNFALALASNKLNGITATWNPQSEITLVSSDVQTNPSSGPIFTPETEEQRLESLLIAGGLSDSTRAAVLQQAESQGTQTGPQGNTVPAVAKAVDPAKAATAQEKQDQLLAGLLLGSPEFQRR
jgi:uncharacterized protein (DUF1800 family)